MADKVKKTYKVENLVRSKEFIRYADILVALFGFNQAITKEQANKAIKAYLKKEVK